MPLSRPARLALSLLSLTGSALIAAPATAAPAVSHEPITSTPEKPTAVSGLDVTVPGSTHLSGVTVVPPSKQPPAIISTYPADGDTVKPGALVLKLTFDQRMNPESWRFDRGDERYPACLARPRLLNDEKTFVLLCTVGGDGKFQIQMNGPGDGGFANLANQRAKPLLLKFSTQDGASLSTIKDAIKSAGLKDEDDPVMDKPAAPKLQASVGAPKPTQ